ncbi:MAG: hypothetical protein ACXV5Q_12675 [Frankiaceae bacterium]
MGTIGPVGGTPSAEQTELIRTRVRLVVGITTRAGKYRRGLERAAAAITPQEAAIVADLAERGMDVDQLRDVLWGGHVLVDDPGLYERWKFPQQSRQRISSHHHDIDKKKYPDIGMHGPFVREKLHGRTAQGTWVQLEKTPAAIGAKKLPSAQDLAHLMDYIVYRVTRRNVGPWGLSHRTERRPMYLNPDLTAQVSLHGPIAAALAATLRRIDADERASAVSDLAHRFPAPQRDDPVAELEITAERGHGRGLFGSSQVSVTETPVTPAGRMLVEPSVPPRWSLPEPGPAQVGTVRLRGGRTVRFACRVPGPRAEEARTP